jgi:phosphopentomutase
VPVLVSGPRYCPVELGARQGFSDMGQTLAAHFGLSPLNYGASFLKQITLESPL